MFSSWSVRLLVVSVGMSGTATCCAIAACPLQSLALQRSFLYLSIGTLAGSILSTIWMSCDKTPLHHFRIGLGLIPFLLAWLILLGPDPQVQKVREGSARTQMINNGKQLVLAMHDSHDANKWLPGDLRDPANNPLLSWRVAILPYIDQGPLYAKFDLTQSWNSPRNQRLVDDAPYVYRSIMFETQETHTPWQGFVGPNTAFEPGKKLTLRDDFPDGTSNTIFFVEAKVHVPWTKPADLAYGPGIALPPLGNPYPQAGEWPFCCPVKGPPRFLVCMADCTVRMFSADMSESTMRALIERNDGKIVELPDE